MTSATPSPSTDPASEITSSGRWWRLVAAAAVFGVLTVGAFLGSDDHFPFGPFRMYATSSQATGEVAVVALQIKSEGSDWTLVRPSPGTVGMNVAEFEGQLPRFEEDPDLLAAVAASRSALHPDEPAWTDLRIVRQATEVVDKVPTGEVVETVLAQWSTAPDDAETG
ncbi:MAG: hypothetical protein LH645_05330 [Actinomycetia bacterium]|nr:hypothetical protein [Actinomycetes bacterium]